jgi:iron complex outermembrane recepter protein
LRHCWLGIGLGVTYAGGTLAQTQPPEPARQADPSDEVIVTGTRLPEPANETAAPIIILTREQLERGGANSVGDALQALPMNTGAQNNTNDDFSLGATRMNLRGLGPERTLVLLNGRRLPNGGVGGDTSVDLNMLPLALIERAEVLTTGASAVYGSDAVGGVVNLITRRPGEASTVEGAWRVASRGDGQVVKGSAVLGFGLGSGAVSFGIDYVRQQGVFDDRRDYSAQPLRIIDSHGTLGYAGQNGIPDGQFQVPDGNLLGLPAGRYMRIPGASGQAADAYRLFTREDSYSVSPYNYSQTPNERGAAWLLASQPLADHVSLFFEGLYHHRQSSQAAAPEQFLTLADPTPTLADGTNGIPASNYYNPFGVDLPFAARRIVEGPARELREDIDVWRLVAGLEGSIGARHWEVAAGVARGSSNTRSNGSFAGSRYVTALGPSGPAASGQIVCGLRDPLTGFVPAANIIPGCVPLDIFDGAGSITQAQLDYVSPRPIVDSGTNEQSFAEASLRGRSGQMLGGDVRWAVGVEYRREGGNFVGDPLRALGYQSLVDPALPGGTFDARELFAEVQLPVIAGRTGAPSAWFNLGARWSDFTTFGHNPSWDAGLRWQLTGEVTLRANYATVFRTPDLQELFQARTAAGDYEPDPCGNNPTPVQRTHCAANGVPGGAYVQDDSEFAVISGGNPALKPETGETYGTGVIYNPDWAHGLSASVDWYVIKLSGLVDSQDVGQLLFECAQYGTAGACESIHRVPDGRILLVAAVNHNFGGRNLRGTDASIDGHWSTRVGGFSVALLAAYLDRWDEQLFAGGQTLNQAGRTDAGALPHWRGSAHLDWNRGRWSVGYGAEYIGTMTEEVEDFPPLGIFFHSYPRQISSMLVHDLELRYLWPHDVTVDAAVTNFTNKAPPFVNSGLPENTDPGTYRLLGRTFFLRLTCTF